MGEEKKFYLTKKGLENVKKEYDVLRDLRFAKMKGEAPKILESEDLNPEYLSYQEDLSFIERRLDELENILKNARLIKPPSKENLKIINLGATVMAEVEREKDEVTIVGTLEADPIFGKISNESPVGGALLGHRIGDTVIVSSPIKVVYKIKNIKYKNIA